METEDTVICEIKCDADCHPVGVAVAPLVDGTWAWEATSPWTSTSGRSDAPDYLAMADWLPGYLTTELGEISSFQLRRQVTGSSWEDFDVSDRRPCLRITRQAKLLARSSEQRLSKAPVMSPDCRMRTELSEEHDPYLVASDASCYGDHAAWACVTGAGWVASDYRSHHMNPTEAELWGVHQAIRLYPDKSPVKVITDSNDVVEIIGMVNRLASDAVILRRYPITSGGALTAIRGLFNNGTKLDVSWVRRNTREIQVKADSYANQTRNSPSYRNWLKRMDPPPGRGLIAV